MVSKQMQKLKQMLSVQKEMDIKNRIKAARKNVEQIAKFLTPLKDAENEYIEVNGIKSAWVTVPESKNDHVILYLHGGAYCLGSFNMYLNIASRLAKVASVRVLLIDYRLAPEHKFPAALEDAIKAYEWLIAVEKISPKNMIIMGDSAGGGLTLATLLKLRDSGKVLPAAAVTLSAWTDLTLSGDSVKINAEADSFITSYDLVFNAFCYVGYGDPTNPLASPVFANFTGLPPLLMQATTSEILLDDSVRVAEKARKQGVEVELDIWDDLFHAFPVSAGLTPESQEAIDKIGVFCLKFFK